MTASQFYFGLSNKADAFSIGDAAGFIPPLTGNGISLALRGSKLAFDQVMPVLTGDRVQPVYVKAMQRYNQRYLRARIRKGVLLQSILNAKPEALNRLIMKHIAMKPFALKRLTQLAVGTKI